MIMWRSNEISAVRVALLLEPGEAESVRVEAGDDVVQLVAVDVVDDHLGATGALGAAPAPERLRVIRPVPWRAGRRLFPPAGRLQDVDTTVAVDVAGADTVGVRGPGLRDRVEVHGAVGFAGSGLGVTPAFPSAYRPVAKTISGLPSPSMSLMTTSSLVPCGTDEGLRPAPALAFRVHVKKQRRDSRRPPHRASRRR